MMARNKVFSVGFVNWPDSFHNHNLELVRNLWHEWWNLLHQTIHTALIASLKKKKKYPSHAKITLIKENDNMRRLHPQHIRTLNSTKCCTHYHLKQRADYIGSKMKTVLRKGCLRKKLVNRFICAENAQKMRDYIGKLPWHLNNFFHQGIKFDDLLKRRRALLMNFVISQFNQKLFKV